MKAKATVAPHPRPKQMKVAAENLEFERAAELRDRIRELRRLAEEHAAAR